MGRNALDYSVQELDMELKLETLIMFKEIFNPILQISLTELDTTSNLRETG